MGVVEVVVGVVGVGVVEVVVTAEVVELVVVVEEVVVDVSDVVVVVVPVVGGGVLEAGGSSWRCASSALDWKTRPRRRTDEKRRVRKPFIRGIGKRKLAALVANAPCSSSGCHGHVTPVQPHCWEYVASLHTNGPFFMAILASAAACL